MIILIMLVFAIIIIVVLCALQLLLKLILSAVIALYKQHKGQTIANGASTQKVIKEHKNKYYFCCIVSYDRLA